MRARSLQVTIVVALLALGTGAARAASPPPSGPPTVAAGPALTLVPATWYPFDFRFSERVFGTGFRAHEQVHLAVERLSAAGVTATADSNGQFSASLSFSWVFCGPNASVAPAPIVVATGVAGSRAQAVVLATPCPSLIVSLPLHSASVAPGAPAPGEAGAGKPVSPAAPEPTPLPDPRLPVPSIQGSLVLGFGFVPGEVVRITEMGAPSAPSVAVATADGFGRVRTLMRLWLPSPCSALAVRAWLQATGNRGTSAAAPLGFWRVVAIPCPVRGTPGGGTVPTTPPSPAPSQAPSASTSTTLGLHLGHQSVRPGGAQSARVSLSAATPLTITVRYADGRTQAFHRHGSAGSLVVRWHVPRPAARGNASVTLSTNSPGLTLEQHFTVR